MSGGCCCLICLLPLNGNEATVANNTCGHMYHDSCLQASNNGQGPWECPLPSCNATTKEFTEVFLPFGINDQSQQSQQPANNEEAKEPDPATVEHDTDIEIYNSLLQMYRDMDQEQQVLDNDIASLETQVSTVDEKLGSEFLKIRALLKRPQVLLQRCDDGGGQALAGVSAQNPPRPANNPQPQVDATSSSSDEEDVVNNDPDWEMDNVEDSDSDASDADGGQNGNDNDGNAPANDPEDPQANPQQWHFFVLGCTIL